MATATIENPGITARSHRVQQLASALSQAEAQLERASVYSRQQSLRLSRGQTADIPGSVRAIDEARARIAGLKIDLATERQKLDECEGAALAERNQRLRVAAFETAERELADSQLALAEVKAAFAALPAKIRSAESRFNTALKNLAKAKGELNS